MEPGHVQLSDVEMSCKYYTVGWLDEVNSSSKKILVPRSNRISLDALTFGRAPRIFNSGRRGEEEADPGAIYIVYMHTFFLDSLTKLIRLPQSLILVFYVHVILPKVFYCIFKNSSALVISRFRLNGKSSKSFDIIVP